MDDRVIPDDLTRFMRCAKGRAFLRGIRAHLKGRAIRNVRFSRHEAGITTTLVLDNGQTYRFNDEELDLETLREQFSGVFRKIEQQDKE